MALSASLALLSGLSFALASPQYGAPPPAPPPVPLPAPLPAMPLPVMPMPMPMPMSMPDDETAKVLANFMRVWSAHGVIMAVAFAFFFPMGVVWLKVLKGDNVLFHRIWQLFSLALAIVGLGTGVWMTSHGYEFSYANNGHPGIGILVVVLLFFMPFLGGIHHKRYLQYQAPTIWGTSHRWLGRVTIALGVINGGLGFDLNDDRRSVRIAYGIVSGFFCALWAFVVIRSNRSKNRMITEK